VQLVKAKNYTTVSVWLLDRVGRASRTS